MSGVALRTGAEMTVTVEFNVPDLLRWLADEAPAGTITVLPVEVKMVAHGRETGRPKSTGVVVRSVEAEDPPADPPGPQPGRVGLLVCPDSRTVRRGGLLLSLTRLEFNLLHHLAGHPGRVFTREQLLRAVWGDDLAGPRTVDVHIRRLRVKVGGDRPLVSTVRGIGYRLADDASVTVVRGG